MWLYMGRSTTPSRTLARGGRARLGVTLTGSTLTREVRVRLKVTLTASPVIPLKTWVNPG